MEEVIMKIEFLGTAGPMAVPRPLCECDVCHQAREKGVPYSRSCPSLFLHGPNLLFDTSEDINMQLNRSRITEINGLFYSHWHPDHVMGRRVLELLNANYVNHPPQNTITDVFLPEQVAIDIKRFLGTGDHLEFLKDKGYINIHKIKDGNSVSFNDAEVTPFRLAEDYAYGFLVQDIENKILIIPDELSNWEPDNRFEGLDLAILPIGVLEYHPLTRERFVDANHPVLKEECTFAETIEIIKKLNPKKTLLTHINGFSFDDLKTLESRLKLEGLNIEIAYDTLTSEIK
jgi:phosphoribosyl 1,2-cyclic phosphate phosphodiesterase